MNTDRFLTIPADKYHAASRGGQYMSSHLLADFRESPELYRRKVNGEIAEQESPALAEYFHASEPPVSRFRAYRVFFTLQSIPTLDVGLARVRRRTQKEFFPSEATAWRRNRRFPGLCQYQSWNK